MRFLVSSNESHQRIKFDPDSEQLERVQEEGEFRDATPRIFTQVESKIPKNPTPSKGLNVLSKGMAKVLSLPE